MRALLLAAGIGSRLRPVTDTLPKCLVPIHGRPLLDYLMAHNHRPEFTGRFRWEQGSVAVWDNRCSLHIAVDDVLDRPRIMHRVQMSGDRPAGIDAAATGDRLKATG